MRSSQLYSEAELFDFGRGLSPLERLLNGIRAGVSRLLPQFVGLWHSSDSDFFHKKRIASLLLGTALGYFLFLLTVFQMRELPDWYAKCLALLLVTIVSVCMCSQTHMRCLFLLCVLNFTTGAIKLLLTSWIVGHLMNGPLGGIGNNTNELAASISCQLLMLKNLSQVAKQRADEQQQLLAQMSKERTQSASEMHAQHNDIMWTIKEAEREIHGPPTDRPKSVKVASDENKRSVG